MRIYNSQNCQKNKIYMEKVGGQQGHALRQNFHTNPLNVPKIQTVE